MENTDTIKKSLDELISLLNNIESVEIKYKRKLEINNQIENLTLKKYAFYDSDNNRITNNNDKYNIVNFQDFIIKTHKEFLFNNIQDHQINHEYHTKDYFILLHLQNYFIDNTIDWLKSVNYKKINTSELDIIKKYKTHLKYRETIFNLCKKIINEFYIKWANKEIDVLTQILNINL